MGMVRLTARGRSCMPSAPGAWTWRRRRRLVTEFDRELSRSRGKPLATDKRCLGNVGRWIFTSVGAAEEYRECWWHAKRMGEGLREPEVLRVEVNRLRRTAIIGARTSQANELVCRWEEALILVEHLFTSGRVSGLLRSVRSGAHQGLAPNQSCT